MPPELDKAKFINLTQMWHTDSSYRPIPSKGAVLRAVELPPEGGDTLWVNMFAVYDSLNAETQARLATLTARHDYAYPRSLADLPALSPAEQASVPPVEHPLVRTHPDGRKSLYISPVYAPTCNGLSDAESQRLLGELVDWATRDEFTYRHKWQVNDVVMWDNRCTMHRVMPFDWVTERRVMRRTALAGVDPVR
jgi:alpha-ketoglutarate-dependent taurine dioxygenase